jgi:hypothetical protein
MGRNLEAQEDSLLDPVATNKIFSVYSAVQSIRVYEFSFKGEDSVMPYAFTFTSYMNNSYTNHLFIQIIF